MSEEARLVVALLPASATMNTMKNYSSLFLRVGLAFSFLYPAIDGFLHPDTWLSFLPVQITNAIPLAPETLLMAFGMFEIIIALGLLFLPSPVAPAVAAGVALLAITFFNLSSFDIVFRDISLALAAFALAWMHRDRQVSINI